MKITDLLQPNQIALGLQLNDKQTVIHEMVGLMDAAGKLTDAAAFEKDVLMREEKGGTNMGGGIAIPHGKSAAVKEPGLVAVTLADGIPEPQFGVPVRLLFMIAVPEHAENMHIKVLSKLAMFLMDTELTKNLTNASTPEEFLDIIREREELEDQRAEARKAPRPVVYKLLAVTGCPSGVAHTYMAAQALEEKAKQMGVAIKVETNGAAEIGNPLTQEEINAASAIIVAADKAVEMDRFDGKPVLQVPVGAAVRSPEELLLQALSGNVPRYSKEAGGSTVLFANHEAEGKQKTFKRAAHGIYKHIMNGLSYMMPVITGGGAMIALAYLLNYITDGAVSVSAGNQLSWMLYTVGTACFSLMYPVLSAFIASSIGGKPALAAGAVGGYIAMTGMRIGEESLWVTSGFWGALAAGFMAGYISLGIKRLDKYTPKSMRQVTATLFQPMLNIMAVSILMVFVINPPLSSFNYAAYNWLSGLQKFDMTVVCVCLGAVMAVDYGGPFSKAAYLVGTVSLMNGKLDVMAAVMVAGMTPPIGVALACVAFPNRFSKESRKTVLSNLIMGASFVTEGALPFAMQDSLHVTPAAMIGSGIAAGLASELDCGVPVPYGGLYVLPIMEHPFYFLLALFVGSAVTALLLGVLKRPLTEEEQEEAFDDLLPGEAGRQEQ